MDAGRREAPEIFLLARIDEEFRKLRAGLSQE
jgi:hypothetical protein